MNKEYHDGTEPDSLPHYTFCNGPCNQGRAPCPCPQSCERESAETDISVLGLFIRFVIITLAFIGLGALVGYFA